MMFTRIKSLKRQIPETKSLETEGQANNFNFKPKHILNIEQKEEYITL